MRVSFDEALKRGWIKLEDVPQQARAQLGPFATAAAQNAAFKIKKSSGKAADTAPAQGPKKRDLEGLEQAELIAKFRARYPELAGLLIHIPNGGYRKNKFEGWRLKEQGVRAGVSDLFLPVARKSYHGLWIEFKAAPPNDAAVSESQELWLVEMRAQGYAAYLCRGVVEALKVIEDYLSPGT